VIIRKACNKGFVIQDRPSRYDSPGWGRTWASSWASDGGRAAPGLPAALAPSPSLGSIPQRAARLAQLLARCLSCTTPG